MRKQLLVFLIFVCNFIYGQTDYTYRYWFNEDLSTLNEGALTGNVSSIELPTDQLKGLLHFVHFQVRDSLNQWSSTVSKMFVLKQHNGVKQDLTGQPYRYWFDDDLSTLTEGTLTGNVSSIELPADQLKGLLHFIHFQVSDSLNQWSSTVSKMFVYSNVKNANNDLTGQPYRYWFDNDLSTLNEGTLSGNVSSIELPTDQLEGLLHFIHFQVSDSLNHWSSTVSKMFVYSNVKNANNDLTGQPYRYWFDNDLSTLNEGTLSGNVSSIELPTDQLEGLLHFIHFQVRDSLNQWSSTVSKMFVYSHLKSTSNDLTGQPYRYWFDTNVNKVVEGTLTGNIMTLDANVAALPDGDHTMHFVVRNSRGEWSSTASREFSIYSDGLTLLSTGNGEIVYADSLLRDDAANFDVQFGTPITIYITPDEGYDVQYIILNRADTITNQLAIDPTDALQRLALNLTSDSVMTVEVAFDLTDYMRLGDVNDDGLINVADLAMTVKYLVGGHPSPFIIRQADANNDGDVNVGDIVRIVNIITGEVERGKHDAKSHYAKSKEASTNALLTGQIADDILNVNLDKAEIFTSFQMSLSLPEGIDVSDIRLGQSYKRNHQLATGQLDDGRINVVVYSPSNSPMEAGSGPLLDVHTKEANLGDVVVDDIVFVDNKGNVHKFATMHISASTGVKCVESQIQKTNVHDLGGRYINRNSPLRGIYIVGGKKIIFK